MSAADKMKTLGKAAAATVGAAFVTTAGWLGIKNAQEEMDRERLQAQYAAAQARGASALKMQIAENQEKIRNMSHALGQANPQSNFRAMVRGAGAGVDSNEPNVTPPELNL